MEDACARCQRDESDGKKLHANALNVVDQLSSLTTIDALVESLDQTFRTFAIEHFVITGLPTLHDSIEREVMLRHWPRDWADLYIEEKFIRDDPVVRMCRRSVLPFEWSEAHFDAERELRASKIMTLSRDFGLHKGFCVPIHGLRGFEACFSLSGATPDFDRRSKPAIHLIAMYAFERAHALATRSLPRETNPLTGREREVLTWAAFGKSHAEIADILDVTERTITAHTINATNKLGAANRTQAVVRAMQANLIHV